MHSLRMNKIARHPDMPKLGPDFPLSLVVFRERYPLLALRCDGCETTSSGGQNYHFGAARGASAGFHRPSPMCPID